MANDSEITRLPIRTCGCGAFFRPADAETTSCRDCAGRDKPDTPRRVRKAYDNESIIERLGGPDQPKKKSPVKIV